MLCELCPRKCGIDRGAGELGFCGVGDEFKIARAAPHMWEEPVISGQNGSGAIFFSGCSLRCVFCQNKKISHSAYGRTVTDAELERLIFELVDADVHNINFVTATHYTDRLVPLLERIKPSLPVPIVWNSSGYERVSTLSRLDGLVDIYLPDLKYFDPELSKCYSSAPDYFPVAIGAIKEMCRQVGAAVTENGIMKKGVIVRHLVLPGCRKDSLRLLDELAAAVEKNGILLSLMSQYTPEFLGEDECEYKNLTRRVTRFEYESVLARAAELGFEGFSQDRSSATAKYTPEFFGCP
ncbi:MAG: radical SAM protein [Ruminococcaceae bacterium]|nr:radical SAM protein [Oscillospiraceae bacterium]